MLVKVTVEVFPHASGKLGPDDRPADVKALAFDPMGASRSPFAAQSVIGLLSKFLDDAVRTGAAMEEQEQGVACGSTDGQPVPDKKILVVGSSRFSPDGGG